MNFGEILGTNNSVAACINERSAIFFTVNKFDKQIYHLLL